MNRDERITQLLQAALNPQKLQITNDSEKHAGHAHHLGGAGFTGDTHYSITIVSEKFKDLSRIERHRMVNDILRAEFLNGLHALQLKTMTEAEILKD